MQHRCVNLNKFSLPVFIYSYINFTSASSYLAVSTNTMLYTDMSQHSLWRHGISESLLLKQFRRWLAVALACHLQCAVNQVNHKPLNQLGG